MNLTLKEKVSYGIGAFGKDFVYMLVATYILFYYESVIGVDSVYVGAVLMVARVFDAFNDPFMGIVVAKTKTRWGRLRPWIFSGTIINAIVLYGLFAVPESSGNTMNRVWLTVFYITWGITYTFMDIPYWSFIPVITEPGKERENISSMARSCAGIGSAIPTVLTMIIVPVLGAGSAMSNYRIGFKYWALIVAVIFVVSEIICCMNVREKHSEKVETHGVKEMFKSLISNDQAMIVVIAIILINTSLYLTSNLVIYFFTYDIGDGEGAYSIFSAFGGASQIIAMMVFPLFRKKFNKKDLFKFAVTGEIVGYIVLLAVTFSGIIDTAKHANGWFALFIPGFMIFFGSGLLNVLTTIFLSDTIEYGEMKNNRRDESVIFSMQTFVVKLASGFAALFAGISISIVGLKTGSNMTAADQTASAVAGLRFVMTVIPIAGLVVAGVIFTKKYILDEDTMKRITKKVEE